MMNEPSESSALNREDLRQQLYAQRSKSLRDQYSGARHQKVLWIIGLLILLGVLLIVGLSVGGASFDVRESWRALLSGITLKSDQMDINQKIIWTLRVPRVLMAIIGGIGLAVAGLVMQTILRNPLASPYTLGISSAASFGAAMSIVLGISTSTFFAGLIPANYIIASNSFLSATICTLVIYGLSRTQRVTAETVVLFGVATNFLFSAATSFLQYVASEEKLAELVYWMFGSLSKATWSKVQLSSVVVAFTLVMIYIKAWDFNALLLGDETAGSLGLNVERLRVYGLLLSSLSTSVIVSLLGPIGFIGLVAPHIARILIGSDHRYLIPITALLGACLLVLADVLSCVILAPVILPVGIVTSFVGVPLLIYLVTRRRAEHW